MCIKGYSQDDDSLVVKVLPGNDMKYQWSDTTYIDTMGPEIHFYINTKPVRGKVMDPNVYWMKCYRVIYRGAYELLLKGYLDIWRRPIDSRYYFPPELNKTTW